MQSAVKEKIASLGKNGPANERRNELKGELDSLRSQQAGAKTSRTRILDELKSLQEENQKKVRVTPTVCTRRMLTRCTQIKDLQASKGKVTYKTVQDVDNQIRFVCTLNLIDANAYWPIGSSKARSRAAV
jgi:hypothetical protein